MSSFTEYIVEDAALAWLEAIGYSVLHGPDIAFRMPDAERDDPNYRDVVLEDRMHQALVHLNPDLPPEALEDAYRKLTRGDAPSLVERNHSLHRMLVDGVTVEYRRKDGSIAGEQAQVIDFATPGNNDWLAVNQFTVSEAQHTRRLDLVLFVNGLPLAVIELKNPADENATVTSAFQQLETYQAQIPALFASNAVLVVSEACRRASARWVPAWSGSSPGAPSPAARMHPRGSRSCRWCWRACSSGAASSICCATSSSSRIPPPLAAVAI